MEDFINKYFQAIFRLTEIIDFLKDRHGINFNLCMVHRLLKRANCYRKDKQSLLLDILAFIKHKGERRGSFLCYRAMHKRCIRNPLTVSGIIVAQIMKHFYPIGVNTRKKGH